MSDGYRNFQLPKFGEAAFQTPLTFDISLAANAAGISPQQIQTFLNTMEPALRALTLCGYKCNAIELSSDGAPNSSRIIIDLVERSGYYLEDPTDDPFWTSGSYTFICVVRCKPYYKPNLNFTLGEPNYVSHVLPLPAPTGGWFLTTHASNTSEPDAFSFVENTSYDLVFTATTVDGTEPSVALATGSINSFKSQAIQLLIDTWQTGATDEGLGLLWLFNPEYWYPVDEDMIFRKEILRKIGRQAFFPPTASDGQLQDFISGQVEGDVFAEQVLFMASQREKRSTSRAKRFLKNVKKWGRSDSAPVQEFTDKLELAINSLGWFDLLMLLMETGFIRPSALPLSASVGPVVDDDEIEYEALIGAKLSDYAVSLQLYGVPNPAEPGSPYGEIVNLSCEVMAVPHPTEPGQSRLEMRQIEEACVWEYIPANAASEMARLIIVAAPGVSINKIPDADLYDIEIVVFRKNDYALPRWGSRIPLTTLFQQYTVEEVRGLRNGNMTSGSTKRAWRIRPGPKGTSINFYQDYPLETDPDANTKLANPTLTIDIEIQDELSPNTGYRFEPNFVYFPGNPSSPISALDHFYSAILNIIKHSDNIIVKKKIPVFPIQMTILDAPTNEAIYTTHPIKIPIEITPGQWPSSVYHPVNYSAAFPVWSQSDFATYNFTRHSVPANLVTDNTPFSMTLTLLLFEIALGFTPAGNAADVAEALYARETGFNKWGQPVAWWELYLMYAAAGLPIVSGPMLTAAGRGAKGMYEAVSGLADPSLIQQADELLEGVEALEAGIKQIDEIEDADAALITLGDEVASGVASALPRLLGTSAGTVAETSAKLGDLLDEAGTAFIDPSLQHAFREWQALQAMQEGLI